MIMLNDVLEHLHDSPRILLSNLLSLAKPDALLFDHSPKCCEFKEKIICPFG